MLVTSKKNSVSVQEATDCDFHRADRQWVMHQRHPLDAAEIHVCSTTVRQFLFVMDGGKTAPGNVARFVPWPLVNFCARVLQKLTLTNSDSFFHLSSSSSTTTTTTIMTTTLKNLNIASAPFSVRSLIRDSMTCCECLSQPFGIEFDQDNFVVCNKFSLTAAFQRDHSACVHFFANKCNPLQFDKSEILRFIVTCVTRNCHRLDSLFSHFNVTKSTFSFEQWGVIVECALQNSRPGCISFLVKSIGFDPLDSHFSNRVFIVPNVSTLSLICDSIDESQLNTVFDLLSGEIVETLIHMNSKFSFRKLCFLMARFPQLKTTTSFLNHCILHDSLPHFRLFAMKVFFNPTKNETICDSSLKSITEWNVFQSCNGRVFCRHPIVFSPELFVGTHSIPNCEKLVACIVQCIARSSILCLRFILNELRQHDKTEKNRTTDCSHLSSNNPTIEKFKTVVLKKINLFILLTESCPNIIFQTACSKTLVSFQNSLQHD